MAPNQETIVEARTTFVGTVREQCARLADATAFYFLPQGEVDADRHALTFRQVDEHARAVAAELTAAGAAGQRALLLYAPGLDFVTAFLGCLYAGVIAVPTYPPDPRRFQQSLARLRAIAGDCAASLVLTQSVIADMAAGMQELAPDLAAARWVVTDRLSLAAGERFAVPERAGGDVAFLQYTSGSTATPRGVRVTLDNLLHNSRVIQGCFGGSDTVGVNWLPNYHDLGLIGAILQPLFGGFLGVLMPPMAFLQRPVRWLEAITHFRGTVSAFPNFALDLCARKVDEEALARLDLASWRIAWNGAEPVRAATLERFADRFARCGFNRAALLPGYGLAEATLFVSGTRPEDGLTVRHVRRSALARHVVEDMEAGAEDVVTLVGCGRIVADTEVIVVDPERHCVLPPGMVGELWARGPSVASGYWGPDEISRDTFGARLADSDEGPFLRTGDLGFTCDGQLFFTGRRKDVIVIRGANYYPQDVERAVEACHPALRPGSAAAVALADRDREALGVIVEVREGLGDGELDEVVQAIREAVADAVALVPDTVALMPLGGLPKTSSGKVQRYLCREGLTRGTLPMLRLDIAPTIAAVPVRGEADVVSAFVIDALARVTGRAPETFGSDTRLAYVGLDSLRVAELVVLLETRCGPLRKELFADPHMTVGDLLGALGGVSRPQPATPATDPPRRETRVEEFAELGEVRAARAQLDAHGLANPFARAIDGVARDTAAMAGVRVINFATFNYLGLAGETRVSAAACQAIADFGTSASASRVASGERPVHRALERDLAAFLGCEDALVAASGHATNVTTVATLVGRDDVVLHDQYAHDSLVTGARLSGARRLVFPHNDMAALERMLADVRGQARRALILVDGVYSMDGDVAPLAELVALKRRHGALLYVDEAHALGVIGATGRGLAEHAGVPVGEVDVWMGTLSKALASEGGYVAGSRALIELLRYRGGGFVFATALAPAAAAAAREALRILAAEPERVTALRQRAALLRALCRGRGIDTGTSASTAIVPIIIGDSLRCLRVAESLHRNGVSAPPIIHPGVAEGRARVRLFVNSLHTETQLVATADALAAALAQTADAATSRSRELQGVA